MSCGDGLLVSLLAFNSVNVRLNLADAYLMRVFFKWAIPGLFFDFSGQLTVFSIDSVHYKFCQ